METSEQRPAASGWDAENEDSLDTVRPASEREVEPDDDEEIVVVARSRLPELVFGALGVGLLAGAVALIAVSLPAQVGDGTLGAPEPAVGAELASERGRATSDPEAVGGAPAAEPVQHVGTGSVAPAETPAAADTPRVVAPILPNPPPEIGGEGEKKPRRRVSRAGTASRPPPLAVGALPPMSVSALPPAE